MRQNLELTFTLSDETMCSIQLPHLKILDFKCNTNHSINSVLRTICENGIIEELKIHGGVIDVNVEQPPLNFNKLRSITWVQQKKLSGILKTFTKSLMPEIQSIYLYFIKTHDLEDLYKFIVSKNTLKTIEFQCIKML